MISRRREKHGRARTRHATVVALLSLLALLSGVVAGCAEGGFECGRPLPNDGTKARRCDRALEVCICATGGCARRLVTEVDRAPDRSCGTNLRYVDAPYGGPSAGQCVDEGHVDDDFVLDETEIGHACPGSVLFPAVRDASAAITDSGAPTDAATPDPTVENDAAPPPPLPVSDASPDTDAAPDDPPSDADAAGGQP